MIDVVSTQYGRILTTDTDIGQYDWLRIAGVYWEQEDIEEVQNLLGERPRGTIVDVGASFGCWTLAIEPYAERVLAFEPQPAVYHMLCGTLALNHLYRKIKAHNCALWSRRATLQIPVADFTSEAQSNSGGISVMVRDDNHPHLPRETIEAYTLGDFVGRDEHVSFIKMDVEGAENDVLIGMLDVVARCRPLMFIESDHRYTDKPRLCGQILELGYAIEQRDMNILCVPV